MKVQIQLMIISPTEADIFTTWVNRKDGYEMQSVSMLPGNETHVTFHAPTETDANVIKAWAGVRSDIELLAFEPVAETIAEELDMALASAAKPEPKKLGNRVQRHGHVHEVVARAFGLGEWFTYDEVAKALTDAEYAAGGVHSVMSVLLKRGYAESTPSTKDKRYRMIHPVPDGYRNGERLPQIVNPVVERSQTTRHHKTPTTKE